MWRNYEHRQNTMGLNSELAIGRLLQQAVGKRLTYADLIAAPESQVAGGDWTGGMLQISVSCSQAM